jgi:HAE1 family hydrophobic/amphiphilic exporter-1
VAIVVIGGQSLCLLLTLLVTPVMYSIFDDLAGKVRVWVRMPRIKLSFARFFGIFLLFLAASGPVFAQEPARVGVGAAERKLTLKEAIEEALQHNLDIEIERANQASASAALRGARAPWDPTFRWTPLIESRNTPAGSLLVGPSGKLSETYSAQNFAYRQRVPGQGTLFGVDFENSRLTTTNPFISLNPNFTSRLVFSLTQPLWRGRSIDPQRAELKIRRKQVDVSAVDFELRTIDVVTRVEHAYWDLSAVRQDSQVKAEAVEWARQQLAMNKRMIAAGTLAPVELAASEAELERRLDAWYASVGLITEAENNLKLLIAGGRKEEMWNDRIVPEEQTTRPPVEVHDLQEAVAQAVKARPELRRLAELAGINDIQKSHAKDATRPQVNLVGAYAGAGLSGSLRTGENPITASSAPLYARLNELSALAGMPPLAQGNLGGLPGNLVGGYGSTLSNVLGGNYGSVSVGLSIDLNIRNTGAEASLAQTAIAERRLQLQQAQAEQTVTSQVRNALQALQTAQQRITAAEASARAAGEKLQSETRLFQTGESTNFLVLTRQNEYADARHRVLLAQLDYNRAVARSEQALGKTLETHGISLR